MGLRKDGGLKPYGDCVCETCEKFRRLDAKVERLTALLLDVEWTDLESDCQWCGNLKWTGHADDCKLKAALIESEAK